jgi:hypothetical protein
VQIPWWNTRTDQLEFANLPERTVIISAPPGGLSVPGSVQTENASEATSTLSEADSTNIEQEHTTGSEELHELLTYWQLATVMLASGWLLTGLLWWLNRAKQTPTKVAAEYVPLNARQSLHNLKQACKNNSAQQVRTALLAWHQARTGQPARGLFHVASALGSDALQTHLVGIEAALFSKEPQQWREGAALWKCVQELHQKARLDDDALPRLYPH